ncbi:HNH endonuclease [Halorubrum tailed phage 7]|uniref:HNH endonuclease n=1 Tax=Halorubrum tailed phage 7 TaxID=2847108 RepID=UPI000334835D|nr:HNH endonuclease [Halorubrum tailed phage 7]AGM10922.1 HNH protein [Halorubrum tailed phage 7]
MNSPSTSEIQEMKRRKRDGQTTREIANEMDWGKSLVARRTKGVVKKWKDPDWLRERRRDRGMTTIEIAEETPVGQACISKWCNEYDIEPPWRDKETVRELYEERGMSIPELAERWDMSTSGVRRALITLGIDRRPPLHGVNGDKLPEFDYGPEWEDARMKALERDDFTCQYDGCDESGPGLDVHHIVPFREFDDPAEAHRLDNLICYCRKHHKRAEQDLLA